jgi:DNA-binding IclR family transcriptional regulator
MSGTAPGAQAMRREKAAPRRGVPGTRSVSRTIQVLKTVTARKDIGWRLTDLASYCSLDNATAHRILSCLAAEGMVQQREHDRRYVPGPLLFELALALPAYSAFQSAVHPSLVHIAKELNGIAFLFLRSGQESVCIDRTGTSSVNPLTEIGTRHLMAESTAGIAMLLALPRKEQQPLIDATRDLQHRTTSHRRASYIKILQRSRRYGYGVNQGDLVPGLPTVAVPIMDPKDTPFGALALMGPAVLFAGKRLKEIADYLKEAADRIAREQEHLIVSFKRHTMAPEQAGKKT